LNIGELIVFFLIGLISATFGSILGLGGGVFIVPALLFYDAYSELTITPILAVGTSLVIIVITALSSTLSYLKQKKVDVKAGFTFFIGSIPGLYTGTYVLHLINPSWFSLLFGCLLLFFAILMFLRKEPKGEPKIRWTIKRTVEYEGKTIEYGYSIGIGILTAFFVGFLSGLFGIGGGILMVMVLVMLFRFPPHMATATSMFIMIFNSLILSATNVMIGNVEWWVVLMIAPGAWIGGKFGANIAKKMKSSQLMLAFRLVLIVLGVQMIYESLI
jgi:uncharacterized membrane protein YfcA